MLAGGFVSGIVSETVSVVASILVTELSPVFATYANLASSEKTTCTGATRTGILRSGTTVFVVVSMTLTELSVVLATYALFRACAWASVAAGPVQMKNKAIPDKPHNPSRTRVFPFVRVIADSLVRPYALAYASSPLIA